MTLRFALAVLLLAPFAAAEKPGDAFAGAYPVSRHYTPPRDPAVLEKLRRFQNLKFGFFAHWGPYSQWGIDASWSLCPERYDWNKRNGVHANDDDATYRAAYEGLAKTFDPVKFDPEKWADIAADAGMRYAVFTTKHHDGFAMWDTKRTDYRVTAPDCPFHTNPKADITKAVFEAFRKKSFWIGAYFSKPDWHTPYYWSPDAPPRDRNPNYDTKKHPGLWAKFKDFTRAQIDELMTGYGPIDILWLDGGQVQPRDSQDIDMAGIAAASRKKQPGLLVVDRTAGGGYEDFLTPEGTHAMPVKFQATPWEACMTLSHGGWAYNPTAPYHTPGEIVRYLARAVARNGNLLLDVGPDANGELPAPAVERLHAIGAWLKVNGEAIYDTRPLPPYENGPLCFTQKADGSRFVIVLGDKDDASLPASVTVPKAVAEGVKTVLIAGSTATLATSRDAAGNLVVIIPESLSKSPPCAFGWALKLTE